MSLRAHVHRALEPDVDETGWERAVTLFISSLIVLNVVAVVLETVAWLRDDFAAAFRWLEIVSLGVFGAEYLLRLWSCVEEPRWSGRAGRLRWMLSPMAIVDLVAILPSLLAATTVDLRFARSLRLLRMARSLKLVRYSRALSLLGTVLHRQRAELRVTAFAGGLLLLCAASGMYFAENAAQPEQFSSIPQSMWWAVMTLTTVGYGDVYPVTPIGRLLAAVVAMLGIGLFALPAGIIASGFTELLSEQQRPRCPHCGKEI